MLSGLIQAVGDDGRLSYEFAGGLGQSGMPVVDERKHVVAIHSAETRQCTCMHIIWARLAPVTSMPVPEEQKKPTATPIFLTGDSDGSARQVRSGLYIGSCCLIRDGWQAARVSSYVLRDSMPLTGEPTCAKPPPVTATARRS